MSNEKLPATALKTGAGGTAAAATPRRTVGVYDRPARPARLSPPLVVILILSVLASAAAAARFLF